MSRVLLAHVLLFFLACDETAPSLAPQIATPPPDSDAFPYGAIEELVLAVARAGDDEDLLRVTAPIGEPLSLSGAPFGDDLIVHLVGRASGLEVAYGRACSVSVAAEGTESPSPSLYFSRIVKWGPAAAPPRDDLRVGAPLESGAALFFADDGAVVFDPYGAAFREIEVDLREREGAVAAVLGGGESVAWIGGVDPGGAAVEEIEVVIPGNPRGVTDLDASDRLEVQEGPALVGHAAETLQDGSVLIAGGRRPGGDVVGEAWTVSRGVDGVAVPELVPTAMITARAGHTTTRLGDEIGADVLILGGLGTDGEPVAEAELYRPLRSAFEARPGAVLATPRSGHRAIRLPGGFVLVIGGTAGDGTPARALEVYDPGQGVFATVGTLPASAGVTDLAITPLPDGRFLISGGRDLDDEPVATALIARFDPIDGRIDLVATDDLCTPRAGHASVLLCDGTVLVAGGAAGAERYNPPSAGRR